MRRGVAGGAGGREGGREGGGRLTKLGMLSTDLLQYAAQYKHNRTVSRDSREACEAGLPEKALVAVLSEAARLIGAVESE